jgi:hypothetical protein
VESQQRFSLFHTRFRFRCRDGLLFRILFVSLFVLLCGMLVGLPTSQFFGGRTMKYKFLALAVLSAAIAGSALAQTRISGTCKSGKPESSQSTSQSIEVGDPAGHVLMINKGPCTWSVPMEIAGLKSTTATTAEAVDVTGAKFQTRGYVITTMENGDKAYGRYQGMGSVKEGVITGEGTWSYTSGTGKLKGVKAKGTFKSSGTTDAGEFQVEGEYSLPGPSATAKEK